MNARKRPAPPDRPIRNNTTDLDTSDVVRQLRVRRAASQRLVPLECGCSDPWPCRCTEPPISDHALDGWRDAALTLLGSELIPLVPLEVRRALYRRGGPDRVLAELLHQACGGEAA
jgi:hypothetical protein